MYCTRCGAAMPDMTPEQSQLRCGACGHVTYANPQPCVSMLIVSDGRVLLGLRGNVSIRPGEWGLPCGHIEKSESFLDAAMREAYEETHLRIRPLSIINVAANHFPHDVHSLVVVLLAEPVTQDVQAGDDLSRAEWFPLEGPFPEMAFKADVHIIAQYRRFGRAMGIPLAETESDFHEE